MGLVVLGHYVVNVVGHDDRHDGTECSAHDPALCTCPPPRAEARPAGAVDRPDRSVCQRLPGCLASIQRGRDASAMDVAASWVVALHADVEHQYNIIRLFSHCRGDLSAISFEERMSETLPFTRNVLDPTMAQNPSGCIADGIGARALLCGVLLVSDGLVVRWRHHELDLDRRDCNFCIA